MSDSAIGLLESALIVGFGSIGRRHYCNLRSLGIKDIHILRSGRSGRQRLPSPADATIHFDLESALNCSPDFAVVANPTSLHAGAAESLLAASVPVLLEKPVDSCLKRAGRIQAACRHHGVPVSMGYVFRYHPLYQRVQREVSSGRLGRIFHVRLWQASYLPQWHPWEDYRVSYAARRDLGGGVVKTLDHELDMLQWLLGQPQTALCCAGRLSALETDVEDVADMIFRYSNGAQANVHVSFARRDYSRGLSVVGEEGSCDLDWRDGSVSIHRTSEVERMGLPADFDLNSAYVELLSDAIAGFAARPPRASIPLSEGIAALQMAAAALRSSQLHREVSLAELNT